MSKKCSFVSPVRCPIPCRDLCWWWSWRRRHTTSTYQSGCSQPRQATWSRLMPDRPCPRRVCDRWLSIRHPHRHPDLRTWSEPSPVCRGCFGSHQRFCGSESRILEALCKILKKNYVVLTKKGIGTWQKKRLKLFRLCTCGHLRHCEFLFGSSQS